MLESTNFKALDNSKSYYIEPLNVVGYTTPMMSYDPYSNEYYYLFAAKINNVSYFVACVDDEFSKEGDADFEAQLIKLEGDNDALKKKIVEVLSSIRLCKSKILDGSFLSMGKVIKAATKEEYVCCTKVNGETTLCYLLKEEDLIEVNPDELDNLLFTEDKKN